MRVLKAPTIPVTDFASLQFPVLVSDKEDGIRAITHPKLGPVSQTLHLIPNGHIAVHLSGLHTPYYLDGEIVTFTNGVQDDFHTVQSKVMSAHGQPHFKFLVFDHWEFWNMPYDMRMSRAQVVIRDLSWCQWLKQTTCWCPSHLEELERDALSRGKEGLMLRHPQGIYKPGRSTLNEGYLLKVKRFTDDEALVVSLEEQMENLNPATLDERGYTKRTSHQALKRGKRRVGTLICDWHGKEIRVSGFTDLQACNWWEDPSLILDKTITFTYQKHGTINLPRQPKFKGIRYDT